LTNTLTAGTAAGQNVIQSAGTAANANQMTASAGGNTITAATSNTITANGANSISAGTSNSVIAVTSNTLTAGTNNTINALTGINALNAVTNIATANTNTLTTTTAGVATLNVSQTGAVGTVDASVANSGLLTGYGLNITNTGSAATSAATLTGSGYSVGVGTSINAGASAAPQVAQMTDGAMLQVGVQTGSGISLRDTRGTTGTGTSGNDDTFVAVRAAATTTPGVVLGATTNLGLGAGVENTVRLQVGSVTNPAGVNQSNGAALTGSNGQFVAMNDGTVGGQRTVAMGDTNGAVYVDNTTGAVGLKNTAGTAVYT
jgi:hypothetical protein